MKSVSVAHNGRIEPRWDDLRSRIRAEFLKAGCVSEARCEQLLFAARWPSGLECRSCGSNSHTWLSLQKTYKCRNCGYQQSLTAGSIFHGSHKPLSLWFEATATLIDAHGRKRGSIWTIQRFGGTFSLAYVSARRIRGAILDDLQSAEGLLEAVVCVPSQSVT